MSTPQIPASPHPLLNHSNLSTNLDARLTKEKALKNSSESRLPEIAKSLPIIAICHLSWNWVWQRPQQFLSRLARTHPLLFVETKASRTATSFVKIRPAEGAPNVTIAEVNLPQSKWADGQFIDHERRRILQETLSTKLEGRFDHAILWMNDPMAVTAYAGHLGETMLVYDCMDELSQFTGAPPGLIDREIELTYRADVIFCGGRKMRQKRLPANPNTHFYGTGVDRKHFGRATDHSLPVHPEIANLPGPIFGYFGVIDERIDYELLARLADSNPGGSVAMVGPFAKVDPVTLPQRANLYWLGGRPYNDLPSLTKGMDVCMMPFALNEATEYINPTKALEYMAAGKPVVSTALDEVISNFSTASRIAHTHEDFIAICHTEARSPSKERIRAGFRLAEENAWEAIVAKMDGHFLDVLESRQSPRPFISKSRNHPLTQTTRAYV